MRHRKHHNIKPKSTEEPTEENYDKREEPIVLSKITSDIILNKDPDKGVVQKYPADLMALYWFYYYTAKWQGSNNARATTSYTAKGLQWGQDRVRRTKKQLIKLDLIEEKQSHKNKFGEFDKCYIYVKFIWWDKEKINKFNNDRPQGLTEGGVNQRPVISEGNALSTINRNALSTITLNSLNKIHIMFLDEWNKNKIIIHKKVTSKRKQLIDKVLKLKDYTQEEIFKAFQNYATVLHSPDYFWNHIWSMEEFLQRGLNKFVDEVDPLNNFKDYSSPNKQPQQPDAKLSPTGFPLITRPYSKISVLSEDKTHHITKSTLEDWQELLEGYTKQLLKSDIWKPNYKPDKIAVFNSVVSMQGWLEKVDYSIDGGANLRYKIFPLNELITYYILCIDDWWGGWMDGVKDNVFDVNNKIFKMFIREMETSFAVRMHINSEGWVNDSDWEPRD